MNNSLATIEAGLQKLGRAELLQRFRPGLPNDEVPQRLQAAGLEADGALADLYGWHDGTELAGVQKSGSVHLMPGFYFPPLEHSLTDHAAFVQDPRWHQSWLPLLADGGGDFYFVDQAGGGQVRRYRFDESEYPVEYASVSDMVHTLAAAYERDVFFVDEQGYLEMDDDAFAEVAAELNPSVPWWTDPV